MIALLGLASVALGQAGAPTSKPAAVVRCGAVARPAIAMRGGDGAWQGRAVEFCRAATLAAWGPAARSEFHAYRTLAELATAPTDQLAFLSAPEFDVPALRGKLRAGPVIAVEDQVLMVPATSALRRREDLRNRMVCFMIGDAAEDALDGWALASRTAIRRLGFQEPDEMADAYAAGKCAALALDGVEAMERYGSASTANHILPEPLSRVLIRVATPATATPAWNAIVDAMGGQGSHDALR